MTEIRFDPISRRTVSEGVREAIAEHVRTGSLPPGSQLPSERDLCEQFGVARTSVREAIQALITLGLIERRGNRLHVVEHLPSVQLDGDRRKERVHELFEVRRTVEVPIARFAACRASDAEREEIVRLAAQFSPDMPLAEFRQLDRAFHWTIAQACGNRTLAELYGKVLDSLFHSSEFDDLLNARSNRKVVRDVIRNSSQAHQAIAAAIATGDWAAVVDGAEEHLDQVETNMIARMV